MTVGELRELLEHVEDSATICVLRDEDCEADEPWSELDSVTYWRDMQSGDAVVYLARNPE
mgnify:CR=1 FL=1